jgi:hypothetical protein
VSASDHSVRSVIRQRTERSEMAYWRWELAFRHALVDCRSRHSYQLTYILETQKRIGVETTRGRVGFAPSWFDLQTLDRMHIRRLGRGLCRATHCVLRADITPLELFHLHAKVLDLLRRERALLD